MNGTLNGRILSFGAAAMLGAIVPSTCPASGHAVPLGTEAEALVTLQKSATFVSVPAKNGTCEIANLNPSVGRRALLTCSFDGKPLHADISVPPGARFPTLFGSELQSGECSVPLSPSSPVFNKASAPFTPLCGGTLWIRGEVTGARTVLEAGTDILRKAGGAGEAVINAYKGLFAKNDAVSPEFSKEAPAATSPEPAPSAPDGATLRSDARRISLTGFGMQPSAPSTVPGHWVAARESKRVFLTAMTPSMAEPSLEKMDGSEALAWFAATDISGLEAGYRPGTDHPRVDWSSRYKLPHSSPGPDGFSSDEPLKRVGSPAPWEAGRVVLVLAGGFKREHSAFKRGPMATRENGTHYGFAEDGVVLSSLKIGLATVWQRKGEPPRMGVWDEAQAARGSEGLVFARQNGMPLVLGGRVTKEASDGLLGSGNWSGNAGGDELTFRSAVCSLENKSGRKFWVAASFSSATARAAAHSLASLGCSFAMLTDINAAHLGYAAAVVRLPDGSRAVRPLTSSMDDKNFGKGRFMGGADSRDFIYLMEPESAQPTASTPRDVSRRDG